MSDDLAGRNALVTGAARGIGLAIGRALVSRGAGVALVDVDAAALIRIDPVSGAQEIVARCCEGGVEWYDLSELAVEADGQVIVTDFASGFIHRVNPTTGTSQVLSGHSKSS